MISVHKLWFACEWLVWILRNQIQKWSLFPSSWDPRNWNVGVKQQNTQSLDRKRSDWTNKTAKTLLFFFLSQRSAWWTLRSFQGRGQWLRSSLLQTTHPHSSWWRRWSLLPGMTTRPLCRLSSRRWPLLAGDKQTKILLLITHMFSHFT